MKRYIVNLLFAAALLAGSNQIFAQAPPPPPSGHGSGGNQPAGGGAPIEGGIGLMLAMGAAWGGKKLFVLNKKN